MQGYTLTVAMLLFVCVAVADIAPDETESSSQCASWSAVTAIAFVQGQSTTTRRRTSNIPRLNCVGNCPADAQLNAAQCMQVGVSDMGTPSWKCIPQFARSEHRFGFGSIRVECEGCRRSGDTTILKGSCALFYSVVDSTPRRNHRMHHMHTDSTDVVSTLMLLGFVIFACVIGRRMCCAEPAYGAGYPYNGKGPVEGYPVGGHHHYYGGGGGGGGFGTGMLTGLVVGDMLSRPHNHGGYYDNNGSSYNDGGDSWGGGWGGSDGGGFGGGDAV